jgi:hypothetical protein
VKLGEVEVKWLMAVGQNKQIDFSCNRIKLAS